MKTQRYTGRKHQSPEWKKGTVSPYGQFLRQTKDLSSNDIWQWLQIGELKKETEGMIMAAQYKALRTRCIQRAIMELTSPLNVGNATRKKPSIISPVNAQH